MATDKKMAALPSVAHAAGTPSRSEAQLVGGKGRATMRSVALDLGGRITFCEVASGEVVGRKTVKAFDHLEDVLGPRTPKARVAIEACRFHDESRSLTIGSSIIRHVIADASERPFGCARQDRTPAGEPGRSSFWLRPCNGP